MSLIVSIAIASSAALATGDDATKSRAGLRDSDAPREGEVIRAEALARLRLWLPRAVWSHRAAFFDETMAIEIGPPMRDYAPPARYRDATRRFSAGVALSKNGGLEGYVAGQPFPMDAVDCAGDPRAGTKIAWNLVHAWEGSGAHASFRASFFDRRGRMLPLRYEGRLDIVALAHRTEPWLLGREGEERGLLRRGDRREQVQRIVLSTPPALAGLEIVRFRYRSLETRGRDGMPDAWFLRTPEGGSRRLAPDAGSLPLEGAAEGTEVVLEEWSGFTGAVPAYTWECRSEQRMLAPVDSQRLGYPLDEHNDFGARGLSFAKDRWELRRTVTVRIRPLHPGHPYSIKDLVLDRQTLRVLYSVSYDRNGERWRVSLHNGRWHGDEATRDARSVADLVFDVQTGRGTRLEYWDNHGAAIDDPRALRRLLRDPEIERGI